MKKIVIVGGVAGGANAATRARRLSEESEIVVFERGEFVSFANCGLPYHIGGEIPERSKLLVHTPQTLRDRFNIDVRVRSEVTRIDPVKKLVSVKELISGREYEESYDELILSTGAAPLKPAIPGLELNGIFSLRDMNDMDRIISWISSTEIRDAVVVGGGFIGLEMLEQLHHRSLKLTIIESNPQLLTPLDPEMAFLLQEEVREKGITLQLGDGVSEFRGNASVSEVVTRSGKVFPAQLVIFSIGVRPETTLAKAAGLSLGPTGGIRVNERLQTSAPGIWAIGDCIETVNGVTQKHGVIPLAGPANRQGRIVADNIFGGDSSYHHTLGTAIVRVFGLTAAVTGANEKLLIANKIPYEVVHLHPNNHAGYYPGASSIALKVIFSPDDGVILGAQAVGRSGVDKRIDVIATAMHGGMTVDDLAELELCYAPPFGSAKDPVNLAGMIGQNIFSGLVEVANPTTALQKFPKAVLLDVRDRGERERGFIPNSLHIPLNELRARMAELPKDKELLVYCQSGQRSYNACRILSQNGFKCRNLSGAYRSWSATAER